MLPNAPDLNKCYPCERCGSHHWHPSNATECCQDLPGDEVASKVCYFRMRVCGHCGKQQVRSPPQRYSQMESKHDAGVMVMRKDENGHWILYSDHLKDKRAVAERLRDITFNPKGQYSPEINRTNALVELISELEANK